MGKLEEAKGILSAIGMPKKQTNDRSAYVLLALANLKENQYWQASTKRNLRIIDTMNFMAENYGKIYKPNSRETIRKETIHQFVEGAVAERNTDLVDRPTNSPNFCYCLTDEMLHLIKSYGKNDWQQNLNSFIEEKGTLIEKYSQHRDIARVPVVVNGQEFTFSAGDQNGLKKAIIEELAPRFAPAAEVLYIGDAENRDLIKNREKLDQIGVNIRNHDKLPNVVLFMEDRKWLFFIEAVTNAGPISIKRLNEIEEMTKLCTCGKVYITAFPDRSIYKKFSDQLAWETEVWIADVPDHMIHMNGDRFFGPR